MRFVDNHGRTEIWEELWKTQNELDELKCVVSELLESILKLIRRVKRLEQANSML